MRRTVLHWRRGTVFQVRVKYTTNRTSEEFDIVAALKQCSRTGDLEGGKELHRRAVQAGCHANKYVATALMTMYVKCKDVANARDIFDKMVQRDVVTWTCLIMGYAENGERIRALELFTRMECQPGYLTFVAVLKACGGLAAERGSDKESCLEKGEAIHKQARQLGLDSHRMVSNTLMDMYSKCGCMSSARGVFEKMPSRDVVSWTCLITGYVDNGEHALALELFQRMDCKPDCVAFVAALKACGGLASEKESDKCWCLQKGVNIHRQVKEAGVESNIIVATTLVDMYSKCGSMSSARDVFRGMPERNVVSWNSLILGYVDSGESSVAVDLLSGMDCEPDYVTFIAMLKALGGLASERESEKRACLQKGLAIHEQLKTRTWVWDLVVANTLLDMYRKCGCISAAKEVFDRMPVRDVVSWNSLIFGYSENGESRLALELFNSMDQKASHITFVAALKACASLASQGDKKGCLRHGESIHEQVKKSGCDARLVVANTLLDMYCKCGCMPSARDVFDKMHTRVVVSWNTLILGYVENGESSSAMDMFRIMHGECEPDSITFVAALKACANEAMVSDGRVIHARMCRLGMEQDQMVANCLVHLYSKCGCMLASRLAFDAMQSPDTVSWNALVAGYTTVGDTDEVFALTAAMQAAGSQPDGVTFTCLLSACSHAGLVDQGKLCFDTMTRRYNVRPVIEHYNCMVDILGRANRLEEAVSVIRAMPAHSANKVTWKTLLSACKKWKNVEVGKVAFDALQAGNAEDGASYVLMYETCASSTP